MKLYSAEIWARDICIHIIGNSRGIALLLNLINLTNYCLEPCAPIVHPVKQMIIRFLLLLI